MLVPRNLLYASVLGLLFVSAPAAPIHAAATAVDVLCTEHGAPPATARGAGNVRPERDTRGIVADSEIPAGHEPATSASFRATVPVWVHVLAASTSPRDGWVADRQIAAQIQVLNDAFAGRYGGTDTGFRFTHAGTTRTVNPEWFAMETFESEMAAKTALRRGDATTLNLYLNSGAGYLGWAYYPKIVAGEPYQPLDGAVVHFDSLPGGKVRNYNLGHTATHEVGHWRLVVLEREVPGELWLGAGNASGALAAMLVNSKSSAAQQVGELVDAGSSYALRAAAAAGVPTAAATAAADRVQDVAVAAVEQAADQLEAELGTPPAGDVPELPTDLQALATEELPVSNAEADAAALEELQASTARRSTRRARKT